jgi:hypothetical protein
LDEASGARLLRWCEASRDEQPAELLRDGDEAVARVNREQVVVELEHDSMPARPNVASDFAVVEPARKDVPLLLTGAQFGEPAHSSRVVALRRFSGHGPNVAVDHAFMDLRPMAGASVDL